MLSWGKNSMRDRNTYSMGKHSLEGDSLLYSEERTMPMMNSEGFGLEDQDRPAPDEGAPHPRLAGGPLPVGPGGRPPLPPVHDDTQHFTPAPPPGRALTSAPADSPSEQHSGIQRAMGALRMALPFVQKILPMLDGNFGTAVSQMMTPHPQAPPPPANLVPLEDGLAELQTQQRDLRDQIVEQNTSLKRVEDQLEMVREATDRNTLEQQELLEDLKGVGNKINLFVLLALGLLAVSIFLNVVMYLHLQRVLP